MRPSHQFAGASAVADARPEPRKSTETPRVLSVRLTAVERQRLEREASGRPLSSYVRWRLFDDPRSRTSKRAGAISDEKALGRVLSAMGRSPQTGTLKGILAACDEGTLVMGPEAEGALRVACANIAAMRADLIQALGLRPE